MKIRRKFNHWIPQLLNVGGITLYPFILFARSSLSVRNDPILYKHEWIHIEQYRREGVFKFAIKYLWYQVTKGYKKNPYEIEAYDRQYEQFTDEERAAWNEDMKR